MYGDQTSGAFLGQLKNLAKGFLQWVGEEGGEPQHPQGVADTQPAPQPNPQPRRAAGTMLIAPDGRTLFMRRSRTSDHAGQWAFPGGMSEGDETPADTAMRETREEIGDQGGLEPRGMAHIDTGMIDGGGEFHTFAHPVENAFAVVMNNEHDDYKWAPVNDAPQPLHPGVASTLRGFATDPLTSKGQEIMTNMKKQYGEERGERVFYASKNAGKISGVDAGPVTAPGSLEGGGFVAPAAEPGHPRVPRSDQDRLGSGWRSPVFSRDTSDAGTPEGARKAAETRRGGSGAATAPPPYPAPAGAAGAPVTPESGGWKAVAHTQEGRPWHWAKTIPGEGGVSHLGNIRHAGEPRQFIATRSARRPGITSTPTQTVGRFNSFAEAHHAIHHAVKPKGQDMHSEDMRAGWRSPSFDAPSGADYGTSQGAVKAAQTRAAGGGPQQPQPASRAPAAPAGAQMPVRGAQAPVRTQQPQQAARPPAPGGHIQLTAAPRSTGRIGFKSQVSSHGEVENLLGQLHQHIQRNNLEPHAVTINNTRTGEVHSAGISPQGIYGRTYNSGSFDGTADGGWRSPSFNDAAGQSAGGPSSQAQRGAMWAAAGGEGKIGIPQSVGAEFAGKDPGGQLPETTDNQRFRLYDSKTGQSYNVDENMLLGNGGVNQDDEQQPVGGTPEQQYHHQHFKMKKQQYDQLRQQTPPPMYHEKHQQAMNALQREMLDHAQKGGFAHQPANNDAAAGGGNAGAVSVDPIQAQAVKPPTAVPHAVRTPGDWGSPSFPNLDAGLDAGTKEGARKALITRRIGRIGGEPPDPGILRGPGLGVIPRFPAPQQGDCR